MKLEEQNYVIQNVEGFNLTTFLRCMKTTYDTLAGCLRENPEFHQELSDFISEVWNTIEPLEFKDAMAEENMERRRVMFSAIGPEKIFNSVKPELLDKQVIKKKRTRWDSDNNEWLHEFNDVYELYRVDNQKLGIVHTWRRSDYSYAVRCWCTTTNREYWIFVPENIFGWQPKDEDFDAIKAIAWTIQIDIKNPKRIFRQGDIIVVEPDGKPEYRKTYWGENYRKEPLTKDQYLNLMYSET